MGSIYSKKIFISFFTILSFLLVLIGGIYYYLEIYRPIQYAKGIIPLFQELQTLQRIFGNTDVQELRENDYADGLRILQSREDSFTKIRDDLSKLGPVPRKLKQLHGEFSSLVEWILATNDQSYQQIIFISNMLDLYNIFKLQDFSFSSQDATYQEVQKYYEVQIPRAKAITKEAFSREPPDLREVSFTQLKTAWAQEEPELNIVLTYILSQNPDLQIRSRVTLSGPNEREKEALNKTENFIKLLSLAINKNSVDRIVIYSTFTYALKQEFNERMDRISPSIRELKDVYD